MDDNKDKNSKIEDTTSFNDELNAEEKQIRTFVQMNHRRKLAGKQDVDAAWQEFQNTITKTKRPTRKFSFWHLSIATAIGAAAMLAGVLLYQYTISYTKEKNSSDFIALQYDDTPQYIKLEKEGTIIDLTKGDSISFNQFNQPKTMKETNSKEIKTQRLTTPRGMDFKVILSDGSEVWLNAESSIEFPISFQSGVRQVNLQGEAYFKVTHNEQAPFIVHSNQMDIRVLGTEFNLKSYDSEPTHVTLIKGKVEVMRSNSEQPDAELKPGEAAWFDKNGELQVEKTDTYAATQWIEGFFYFHDKSLVHVLRELGRWYNLGVIFRNTKAIHYNIHFSALRNEDINVAIESLNKLRYAQIRLEGNNLVVY